jgi:hypothetical protein
VGISRDPSAHLHKKILFAATKLAKGLAGRETGDGGPVSGVLSPVSGLRSPVAGRRSSVSRLRSSVADRIANAGKVRDLKS